MRKYICISIGGALGAAFRLAIDNAYYWHYTGVIPLNTLVINITGNFILALFLTVAYEVIEVNADLRLGLSTGFLGAFTTFSTLCKETVTLMNGGEYLSAISYITVSTMLGLAAAYSGIILARKTFIKLTKGIAEDDVEIIDEGEE